jgi:hypothetical protein
LHRAAVCIWCVPLLYCLADTAGPGCHGKVYASGQITPICLPYQLLAEINPDILGLRILTKRSPQRVKSTRRYSIEISLFFHDSVALVIHTVYGYTQRLYSCIRDDSDEMIISLTKGLASSFRLTLTGMGCFSASAVACHAPWRSCAGPARACGAPAAAPWRICAARAPGAPALGGFGQESMDGAARRRLDS